ncbi:hypothetical protein ACJX0J_018517, partial [Zea mays]
VVGDDHELGIACLMEVAPKHDALLKGVLDGTLMIGARLLEHLVEQVGPSERLPRVPVLGAGSLQATVSALFPPSTYRFLAARAKTFPIGFFMFPALRHNTLRAGIIRPLGVGVLRGNDTRLPQMGRRETEHKEGKTVASCCPVPRVDALAVGGYKHSRGRERESPFVSPGKVMMYPLWRGRSEPKVERGAVGAGQATLFSCQVSHFHKFPELIITVMPLIDVLLTTLLCASPIIAEALKTQGGQLIIPVTLLHVAAFALGYWLSRLSTFGESTSRTISIECGMQSSALGFLLAQKQFTNALVVVTSAVSVVRMHG